MDFFWLHFFAPPASLDPLLVFSALFYFGKVVLLPCLANASMALALSAQTPCVQFSVSC